MLRTPLRTTYRLRSRSNISISLSASHDTSNLCALPLQSISKKSQNPFAEMVAEPPLWRSGSVLSVRSVDGLMPTLLLSLSKNIEACSTPERSNFLKQALFKPIWPFFRIAAVGFCERPERTNCWNAICLPPFSPEFHIVYSLRASMSRKNSPHITPNLSSKNTIK